jgi:hypothetical protein
MRASCVLLLRIQRLDRSQASRRGAGGLLLPAASSSGPDPATGSRPGEDAPSACGPLLHQVWLPNLHPPVGRSLSYSYRLLFLVSCRNSLMPVDGSKKKARGGVVIYLAFVCCTGLWCIRFMDVVAGRRRAAVEN